MDDDENQAQYSLFCKQKKAWMKPLKNIFSKKQIPFHYKCNKKQIEGKLGLK